MFGKSISHKLAVRKRVRLPVGYSASPTTAIAKLVAVMADSSQSKLPEEQDANVVAQREC